MLFLKVKFKWILFKFGLMGFLKNIRYDTNVETGHPSYKRAVLSGVL